MKNKHAWISVLGPFFFFGCFIPSYNKKEFTLHKMQFHLNPLLTINGLYTSSDHVGKYPYDNCLIFYSDGTFLGLEHSQENDRFEGWNSYFSDALHIKNFDCGKNCWGVYRFRGDTIFLQRFRNTGQSTNVVVAEEGTVGNSGAISFYKWECKKCLDSFPYPPGVNSITPPRKFSVTMILPEKPDSSKAWFKTKSWYKEQK